MSTNPYRHLPDHQFWRRAVAGIEPFRFDPVTSIKFSIRKNDRVATAGSCFAQHISSRLSRSGFNYFVTEAGEQLPLDQRKLLNYGVFSARFGNLYTTRQLLQLFMECFGERSAIEAVWPTTDGRFVDALRPQITPGGFGTSEEVLAERKLHIDAVRQMFENCDVFVFTLGLTETWYSPLDGTVYPLAPGVSGGIFDPERHKFKNLDIMEVTADLEDFLHRLKSVNSSVKVILTVSPVPLIATYESQNVLVATTYSKSVLRVAAESAYRKHDWVEYFPSYEIITGNYNNSAYFEPDYRGINHLGVDHAMRCFLYHYASDGKSNIQNTKSNSINICVSNDQDIVCDEEAIDQIRT